MNHVTSPAGIWPSEGEDGRFDWQEVPGMVKAIPGVPMRWKVHCREDRTDKPFYLTAFCAHTLDSLKEAGILSAELLDNINELGHIAFIETREHVWSHNDRTGTTERQRGAGVTGSFNFGTTVMKGQGGGSTVPSKQLIQTPARRLQTRAVQLIHKIILIVGPSMMSKLEWALIYHHTQICNVVQLGDEPSGPTSVQYNVSSFGNLLHEEIGKQGTWHSDPNDDPTRFTFLIIFLNIGESECVGSPHIPY